MSKEKGLAGMAENVRQGFRAGGRAPKGYILTKIPTGATRDGEAVTKSKLIPGDDASLISKFLKMRAAGISRKRASDELGLDIAKTSAVGIEWNALTYAGHTVWNVQNERVKGSGYKGGVKRRPRSEWVVNENTHEGLITTEEAETILAQLANSTHSKGRRTAANYLLTGLLKTPNGESWFGNGRSAYIPRGTSEKKNRKVDQQLIEQAVLDQLSSDLKSSAFITALTKEAQKFREAHRSDPAEDLRPEVVKIADQISKMMGMASQLEDPAPALREIDKLEKKRQGNRSMYKQPLKPTVQAYFQSQCCFSMA